MTRFPRGHVLRLTTGALRALAQGLLGVAFVALAVFAFVPAVQAASASMASSLAPSSGTLR